MMLCLNDMVLWFCGCGCDYGSWHTCQSHRKVLFELSNGCWHPENLYTFHCLMKFISEDIKVIRFSGNKTMFLTIYGGHFVSNSL